MGMEKYLIVLIIFLFITTLVFSLPGDWKGIVDINGVEPAIGTEVTVYAGTTLLETTTTPTTQTGANYFDSNGFYILAFEAGIGADINFKVCGINTEASTFSSGTHDLNISVDLQANGTIGCTCAGVCSGAYCVNPGTTGVCSSNSYYCNSNGTCESVYGETTSNCSNDCRSTGGGSTIYTGGATSGTGDDTTTDESSITTVLDTTETISYPVEELQTTLEEMTTDGGESLFTPTEITTIIENSDNYTFERNVLVQKIVSTTGAISYKSTVTTTVKNNTTGDLKDVVVVVEVPKEVATSASQVQSFIPFTVLVNDPVIQFNLSNLGAGRETSIIYTVTSITSPDMNNAKFMDPAILSATKVIPTQDQNVPDTTQGTGSDTTSGTGTTLPPAQPDYTLVVIAIIIVIILGLVYIFRGSIGDKLRGVL